MKIDIEEVLRLIDDLTFEHIMHVTTLGKQATGTLAITQTKSVKLIHADILKGFLEAKKDPPKGD